MNSARKKAELTNYAGNRLGKKLSVFYLLCTLLLLFTTVDNGWCLTAIRVGGPESLPRYAVSKDGKPQGVFGDVLAHIAAKEGWKVEYISCAWSDCVSLLKSGQIDLLVPMTSTLDRIELYDFTQIALMTDWGQIYVANSGPGAKIESPLELGGKKVAIVRDSIYSTGFKELMANFGKEPIYIEVDNYADVFRLIDTGIADAGVLTYLYARTNEWNYHVRPSSFIFNPVKLRIAALKGKHRVLLEKLDQHMRQLTSDTSSIYQTSVQKWLAEHPKRPEMPRWLRNILISITAVAFLASVMAILLQIRVRAKTRALEAEIKIRRETEQNLLELNKELAATEDELREKLEENWLVQKALNASKTKYRDIYMYAPVAVFQSTVSGKLLNINPAFAEMFGFKSPGAMLSTVPDINGLFVRQEKRAEMVQKVLTSNGYLEFELEYYRNDGSRLITSSQIRGVRDENGDVIYLEGFATDCTEQINNQKAIKESEERFRLYIQHLPLACIFWDKEYIVRSWNPAAEKIFGYSEQEVIGQVGHTLLHVANNKKRMEATDYVADVWQRLQAGTPVVSGVNENATKDGRTILCEWTETPFLDKDGKMCGVISMAQDITEKRQVEEVMIIAEKMMMISGLAAGMAHEINNPMGIIVQNVQNIERRLSLDLPVNHEVACEVGVDLRQVRNYLEKREFFDFFTKIRNAGQRTSHIINNMLSFSRKNDSGRQPANIAEVVEQSIELASRDYDLRKKYNFEYIRFVREFESDLPSIRINIIEIEQVLLNIIKNSAQAMAGNTIDPEIKISLSKENKSIVINIADNGPGMQEEVRKRIFEPFFTTKEVGLGTGLGLSVSYALITRNNRGTITVDSTIGEGATFTIKLPLD